MIQSYSSALTELMQAPHWVCYREDKCPFNPATGKAAEASNPETWSTYTHALEAFRKYPSKYRGIGREILGNEGLVQIDLDQCVDEHGNLTDFARRIVEKVNSYTEYSPSGTGLHIWVYRGEMQLLKNLQSDPADGPNKIEMYFHGHYLTWTGKHLAGMPEHIEERGLEVQSIYTQVREARALVKKAKHSSSSLTLLQPRKHDGNNHAYGQKALQEEYETLATTPRGSRNPELNRIAFKLGQLVGGNELERTRVESELYHACVQNGLLHDDGEYSVLSTLRSGIEAGIQNPRYPKSEWKTYTPGEGEEILSNGNGNGHNHHHGEVDQKPLKPVVIISRQLEEMVTDVLSTLALAEKSRPSIFVQASRLVKVVCDEEGKPGIVPIGVPELKNEMTAAANYFRPHGENLLAVTPPKEVAEAILALAPVFWPFPAIKAVVEMPVIRPDGSILDTPGYDPPTHLYYYPQEKLDIPVIPVHPTSGEVTAARVFLDGFIADFPYVSPADKANTFGLMVTTVIRHLVRHVPCALINAAKAGTGKGLLTDEMALIATGRLSASLSQVDSDEEWDKRITALLLTGSTFISIDNVEGVLRSPILSKALTADIHTGRILGSSKMISMPHRAIWVANGNNIQLGGDMPRRCFPINMMVQVSDPWAREDFKYPNLIGAIEENRGKIIAALLTLARGWFLAGKPVPKKKNTRLGTFTEWVDLVGSILSFAGIEGFLDNLTDLHEKADVDGRAWANFLETWQTKLGANEYTTKELLEKLGADPEFAETLPDPLAVWYQEQNKSLSRKMGRVLSKKNNTPFGAQNLRLIQGENTHSKVATFKVAGYAGSADQIPILHTEQSEAYNAIEREEKITLQTPHTPREEEGNEDTAERPALIWTEKACYKCGSHYLQRRPGGLSSICVCQKEQ